MKCSSFKKPSPEKIKQLNAKKRAKALEKARQPKVPKQRKKPVKRKKTGKKSKSLAKLKKEFDSVFSKYVRLVHADNDGYVSCYTCSKLLHWKKIQNGHFVSRQYLATRWEEDNCRPQCVGCNVFGNGQLLDYEERLKKELGSDRVEELKQLRHQITKLDRQWYEEQIAYYKNEVKSLQE
jgi:hypothetical protein